MVFKFNEFDIEETINDKATEKDFTQFIEENLKGAQVKDLSKEARLRISNLLKSRYVTQFQRTDNLLVK